MLQKNLILICFPGADRRAQRLYPRVLACGGYSSSAGEGGLSQDGVGLLPAPWR